MCHVLVLVDCVFGTTKPVKSIKDTGTGPPLGNCLEMLKCEILARLEAELRLISGKC